MNSRDGLTLADFDEAVLQRWGLKPTAKETLNRAKERGAITPQEISDMISSALTKDREKMAEVLQEIKKILQNLNISVTFNVVHTHKVVLPPPAPGKPLQAEPAPQQPVDSVESPFLNAKILSEQGLVPHALDVLLVAKQRGSISPQQVGSLIPAEIARNGEKLREKMRWITQLLSTIGVKIVIGSVHVKKAESTSPVTSYSIRPDQRLHLRPSKVTEEEEVEPEEVSEEETSIESENEADEGFVPKFIFDREDGEVANPYYRHAKNHKFLKYEELVKLSRRWHSHGDFAARNEIVLHNLRLAMKIAAHHMGRGLDYDDLVQEGNIGLMTAAERFDPEKGFQFTTYATWWVRSHIGRAIQDFKDIVRMPVHAQEALGKVLKISCELAMELQREPTLEEIAARTGQEVGKVKKILHQLKVPVVSLEELVCGSSDKGDEVTVGSTIADSAFFTPTTALEAKEDLEIASQNIRTLLAVVKALPLNDRHKTVFKMFWGLEGYPEHTHEAIRPAMGGVTRSRIQQMEDKVWQELTKHGIGMTRQKLKEELRRISDLENIVGAEANLTTPTEDLLLEEISVAFQDVAVDGDMIPSVIITQKRPAAKLENTKRVPEFNADDIIRFVCEVYGMTPEVVLGDSRPKDVVWVRWVCTYILKEELKASFVSIGEILRYADHTTAVYGYRSFKKAMERDQSVGEEIQRITALCRQRKEKPVDPAEVALAKEIAVKQSSPIVDQVLTLTGKAFGVEKSSLFARSHTRPDATEKHRILAKNFAMYVLRTDFNVQCQEVTEIFGFGDYSRVSVLCNRMAEQMKTDVDLQKKLAHIREQYSLEVYGGELERIKQCQSTLFPKQVKELKVIVENKVKPFQERVRRLHTKINSIDMPKRHKEIFKHRYCLDATKALPTYEELGELYDGITRERVRQILVNAEERLSPLLDGSDIKLADYAREFEEVRLLVELQKM